MTLPPVDIPPGPWPEGRFAATLTLGPKGQIVIPKGARDLVGIKPGDQILLLADSIQGIAILPATALGKMFPAPPSPPQEES